MAHNTCLLYTSIHDDFAAASAEIGSVIFLVLLTGHHTDIMYIIERVLIINEKEAARLIVSKLSAFGKTLVFEGDPAFVDAADLSKLDYEVLNTTDIENAWIT